MDRGLGASDRVVHHRRKLDLPDLPANRTSSFSVVLAPFPFPEIKGLGKDSTQSDLHFRHSAPYSTQFMRSTFLVFLVLQLSRLTAGQHTLAVADLMSRGWINSTGSGGASVMGNYSVGKGGQTGEQCSFFIFDLTGIRPGERIVSARLALYNPKSTVFTGYVSRDPQEVLQLFATQSVAPTALRSELKNQVAVFDQLTRSLAISDRTVVTSVTSESFVQFPLNKHFIRMVNGRSRGQIIIVCRNLSLDGPDIPQGVFMGTHRQPLEWTVLHLTTVSRPNPKRHWKSIW